MTVEEAFHCVMSPARFRDPLVEAIGDVWVDQSRQLREYGWNVTNNPDGKEEFICSDTIPETSHTVPACSQEPASTAPALPE